MIYCTLRFFGERAFGFWRVSMVSIAFGLFALSRAVNGFRNFRSTRLQFMRTKGKMTDTHRQHVLCFFIGAIQTEDTQMTKIKFMLFIAVLVGFGLIVMLHFPLAYAYDDFKAGSEPDGFRGIKWGTELPQTQL